MKNLRSLLKLLVLLLLIVPVAAIAAKRSSPASYTPDVTFTMKTAIAEGKLVFIGQSGAIDGMINPTLRVAPNAVVQITLVNGDGATHDIVAPDFNAKSDVITTIGASTVLVFRATKTGGFAYYCSIPGHRAAGMEGRLEIGSVAAEKAPTVSIVADPAALPKPVGKRAPKQLNLELEAIELEARLADGATFRYWTFNRQVPGPFVRLRVGDTMTVRFKNAKDSTMIHSVDFHAVTGPGGGAAATQTSPGNNTEFTFKALNPGIFVYHCATPMVAHHIANGMYGLILVEPEEGLSPVDREFYVMQGEIYTREPFGTRGRLDFSVDKLLNERAEYFVFNGAVGALTKERPMKAKVGETVRIYFGVGGPNITSSFHVIGEIFDRVYSEGSLTSPPLTNVQTTLVPTGGATMVEFKVDVPGRYILVDHSLSRLERGLVGFLLVDGAPQPEIFNAPGASNGAH
jgi:nitrite reductase (NO-forming)